MYNLKKASVILQEFSIPLIGGVFVALAAANLAPDWYHHVVHGLPFGDVSIFGHQLSVHFLVNDIFMVFFFGIAAKEITEAALPGGDLNPLRKAINPLLGTFGGVAGPIAVFFIGIKIAYMMGIYTPEMVDLNPERGWGIPTATDIALAWLVARAVFGKGHPAINFLLLLAVADDAIGLGIIAIFYGDPNNPAQPAWLGLVVAGMVLAYILRRMGLRSWSVYIFTAGPLAWSGLMLAHLHPALALVFVVPFLPGPEQDSGLFVEDEADQNPEAVHDESDAHHHSPLHNFEHHLKLFVDFGLFFFAFANAGVAFAGIGTMTWLIIGSLVVGKTLGVGLCSWIGTKLGAPLPNGMSFADLIMASFIAGLGLTVALFVAGAAFTDPVLQGEAKMGALFSGGVGVIAVLLGRVFKLNRSAQATKEESKPSEAQTDTAASAS